MFCSYCGKKILDESRFCNFCGKGIVNVIPTGVNSAGYRADAVSAPPVQPIQPVSPVQPVQQISEPITSAVDNVLSAEEVSVAENVSAAEDVSAVDLPNEQAVEAPVSPIAAVSPDLPAADMQSAEQQISIDNSEQISEVNDSAFGQNAEAVQNTAPVSQPIPAEQPIYTARQVDNSAQQTPDSEQQNSNVNNAQNIGVQIPQQPVFVVPPQAPVQSDNEPERKYTLTHLIMCLASTAVFAIAAGVFAGLYFAGL